MATNTAKLNLVKPELTDAADITAINSNWDKIDNLNAYAKATGTGTAILVNTGFFKLVDGNSFTFIAAANNNSAATTINVDSTGVRSVYKAGTVSAPTFISGKAYTLWYDATGGNFFTKASAEGTASPSDVLAGKTFSNDNDTGLVGTLAGKAAQTYTPSTSNQIISAGQYLAGDQTISGDSDLVAGNIKTGVNIFNVTGTYTSDATAAATDIISGKTAYVNGSKITGTVPTKTAQTFTPGTNNQTIAAGQYLSGIQTIAGDADLVSTNIKSGVSIFGVNGNSNVVDTSGGTITSAAQILSGYKAYSDGTLYTGTIPSKGATTITPGTANQTIAAGQYLSGTQTIAGDADLVAGNIKSGVNIFSVTGSLLTSSFAVGSTRMTESKSIQYFENTSGNHTMQYWTLTFTIKQNLPGTVQMHAICAQGGMNAAWLDVLRNGVSVWSDRGTGTINISLDNLTIGETVAFRMGIVDGNGGISECYLQSAAIAT